MQVIWDGPNTFLSGSSTTTHALALGTGPKPVRDVAGREVPHSASGSPQVSDVRTQTQRVSSGSGAAKRPVALALTGTESAPPPRGRRQEPKFGSLCLPATGPIPLTGCP